MRNYLFEAFKELDCLNENTFSMTKDGVEDLDSFMSNSDEQAISIIDPEANTIDELKDNYIGNVILECCVCHSKIYKKPEDVVIDEDSSLANIEEECPYCSTVDGYKVIGQVAPFKPEADVEVDTNDDSAEVEIDTEVSSKNEEDDELTESFENVHVDLDDAEITIKSKEPKIDLGVENDEMIVPVPEEVQTDIEANADEEPANEEPEDEEEQEVDIEDFDEDTFDELGESYLKEAYDNVKAYKTSKVSVSGNTLFIEGKITFNSGKVNTTKFKFESKDITKNGVARFLGENMNFAKQKNSYALIGKFEGNKFISESFRYNYKVGKDTCKGSVKVNK